MSAEIGSGLPIFGDRGPDALQDPRLNFAELTVEESACGGSVSTAGELPSQFVAIDVATGAEADFEATFELLDEDHRHLGPLDGQR